MLAPLAGQSKFEDAALGVHSRLSGFVEQYGGLLPLYFNPETGQKGRVARNMGSTVTLGECSVPSVRSAHSMRMACLVPMVI